MKDLDIKKLLVFIILIVAIIVGIIFVVKHKNVNQEEKEETKEAEQMAIDYFANLTQGYSTVYGGVDVLYSKDKIVTKDLDSGAIFNTAVKYAQTKGIDLNVNSNIVNAISKKGTFGDVSNYLAFNGEKLRNIIADLFGEDAIPTEATGSKQYLYEFLYSSTEDVYLMRRNKSLEDYTNSNYYIDYKIIEQKKEKDTVRTRIAIAYVFNNNGVITYYKDAKNNEKVTDKASEFPTDYIDDLDKFDIVLKKKDDKYIFDYIEKVK